MSDTEKPAPADWLRDLTDPGWRERQRAHWQRLWDAMPPHEPGPINAPNVDATRAAEQQGGEHG